MSDFTVAHEEKFDHGIIGRVVYDPNPQAPDWDTVGQIAYLGRSRYTLGTESVSEERMDEIRDGIESGELIGLPVYAYVHSGATIRCGAFNDPWDSGQSGFVYCDKERGIKECGSVEQALKCLESEVAVFDAYLTGQVFGYEVVDADGEHLDSCWGFYDTDDDKYGGALEEMRNAAQYHAKEVAEAKRTAWRAALQEARERRYWAQRDTLTQGA